MFVPAVYQINFVLAETLAGGVGEAGGKGVWKSA